MGHSGGLGMSGLGLECQCQGREGRVVPTTHAEGGVQDTSSALEWVLLRGDAKEQGRGYGTGAQGGETGVQEMGQRDAVSLQV